VSDYLILYSTPEHPYLISYMFLL